MRPFRVQHQLACGFHDFGYTGFVIRTQQSGTIRCYQGMPQLPQQVWIVGGSQDPSRFPGQYQITPLVRRMNLWLNMGTRGIGGCIQVRTKTKRRHGLLDIGCQTGDHIAVFVLLSLQTQGLQFFLEHSTQNQLTLRRGNGRRSRIRRGVNLHIAQKTLKDSLLKIVRIQHYQV